MIAEQSQVLDAAARGDALTPDEARRTLGQWTALHEQRRACLQRLGGEPLARADVILTYVEGTARYVERGCFDMPTVAPLSDYFLDATI